MNKHMPAEPVPFIDLAAQRRRLGKSIDEAVSRVIGHCQFINGPEVTQLEAALAAFSGAKHVVSCASGTDALLMVLMAKGVGRGDAVLCPSFTFCATGEAVALTGATPVFVDVDQASFNMDAASLKRGIATAKRLGLKPVAVIPVDLFGQSADHDAIGAIASAEGLFILDDAAQAFGASFRGRRLGTFGLATATSFFPAKPLGCFGDGGAIFTDDAELAATLRSVRVHGQGSDKYDNVRLGLTGRLDTMQAAILIEKLKIFDDEIAARNGVAERYARGLGNVVTAAFGRLHLGLGAIHHPAAEGLRPRRLRRHAEGQGHSDRDLLPEIDASADRLSGFPGGRRRPAGQREPVRRCHQPADACLSRRADAGSGHPGCAHRGFNLISPF
jgi:dTDP-4-amino-4,6-dideoxygalactose transaminase